MSLYCVAGRERADNSCECSCGKKWLEAGKKKVKNENAKKIINQLAFCERGRHGREESKKNEQKLSTKPTKPIILSIHWLTDQREINEVGKQKKIIIRGGKPRKKQQWIVKMKQRNVAHCLRFLLHIVTEEATASDYYYCSTSSLLLRFGSGCFHDLLILLLKGRITSTHKQTKTSRKNIIKGRKEAGTKWESRMKASKDSVMLNLIWGKRDWISEKQREQEGFQQRYKKAAQRSKSNDFFFCLVFFLLPCSGERAAAAARCLQGMQSLMHSKPNHHQNEQ